jgi:hypothetical protein
MVLAEWDDDLALGWIAVEAGQLIEAVPNPGCDGGVERLHKTVGCFGKLGNDQSLHRGADLGVGVA